MVKKNVISEEKLLLISLMRGSRNIKDGLLKYSKLFIFLPNSDRQPRMTKVLMSDSPRVDHENGLRPSLLVKRYSSLLAIIRDILHQESIFSISVGLCLPVCRND